MTSRRTTLGKGPERSPSLTPLQSLLKRQSEEQKGKARYHVDEPVKDDISTSDASSDDLSTAGEEDEEEEEEDVDMLTPGRTGSHPTTVASSVSAAELERLKKLVDQKLRTNQEKTKMGLPPKRLMSGGLVGRRFSPIKEETSSGPSISPSLEEAFASPLATGTQTVSTESTESARTIRGSVPATPSNPPLRTPSYPFPYVPGTPKLWQSSSFHRPFTTLSPTVSSANIHDSAPGDQSVSEVSTPAASAMTFMPSGASPMREDSDDSYPVPNLYDLSVELALEPGLHAWWQSVSRILGRDFLATRASLAVPADASDLENVPWGQIATFNQVGPPVPRAVSQENDLQRDARTAPMAKTPLTPQMLRSIHDTEDERPAVARGLSVGSAARPAMLSRHSYAGYERDRTDFSRASPAAISGRPKGPSRTKSHAAHLLSRVEPFLTPGGSATNPGPGSTPGHSSLASDLEFSSIDTVPSQGPHSTILSTLQGLDHEDHALINSTYVNRIVSRGKVVTLTREYTSDAQPIPAVKVPTPAPADPRPRWPSDSQDKPKSALSTKTGKHKMQLPHDYFNRESRPLSFEEFEQFPSSPWAQSPAPSPAIQNDPDENPFFASDNVDESSFDPTNTTPDYTSLRQVAAIGVDRASTVIHVPLIHPILSQILPSARKTAPRWSEAIGSTENTDTVRKAPIAILSMLTPVVPYPQSLLHSLKMLSLHLATSFGMAQQYTNAQRQASSIFQRGVHAGHRVGFAPFAADRDGLSLLIDADIEGASSSVTDSITSPSENSARSRPSPGGSVLGTPGWDGPTTLAGRRSTATTPAPATDVVDSYFEIKKKSPVPQSGGSTAPFQLLQEEMRSVSRKNKEIEEKDNKKYGESRRRTLSQDEKSGANGGRSTQASKHSVQSDTSDRKQSSYLHSYGADFASSFQMLPTTATSSVRTPKLPSTMSQDDDDGQSMLPPSERLLRTIIDALPVQIFTATPGTGALTWINTKFVAYRGKEANHIIQDPWDAIHPKDRGQYMDQWQQSLSTGQHFSHKVRLQRFDDVYRWFYVRATPLKDKKQNIVHWTGTYMDIHDQFTAEQNAARQVETAASEAKYRALANSSPQIVFAATRVRGLTFCNSQWLSYSGQSELQARSIGFMDFVHPDDLSKCRLPIFNEDGSVETDVPTTIPVMRTDSGLSSDDSSETRTITSPGATGTPTVQMPQAKLSELATTGILKISRDSGGRPSYSTEVRLRNKDGEYRWHLVRVLQSEPVRNGAEEVEEETWYGTCTDINDHKLLEQTLKDTMDAKTRFLSNMSHEIRTPLNGITGMVNFLIDSHLTQEQLEHVNIIRSSTEGLRDLINDILDLSKVEAGMVNLQFEWFHVRSLIEEVNDLTSPIAIGKGLELNYLIEDGVPSNIKGDRFRIRQVLLNVVGNAIKFTQQGEVFVRCELAVNEQNSLENNEIMLRFFVTDTGSGFTKAEAEFLFKRFSQIDSSSTKQHGGTGLGLAISKQLVQLHGGDMEASSVPGEGATFLFYAKFELPSDEDVPPLLINTPGIMTAAITPMITPKPPNFPPHWSPQLARTDSDSSSVHSPLRYHESIGSSGSSDPSLHTSRTSILSTRSSASSIVSAKTNMVLEMPARSKGNRRDIAQDVSNSSSTDSVQTLRPRSASNVSPQHGSPLKSPEVPVLFSILVVCPLKYTRQAIVKHMETTIPRNAPHHITAPESLEECKRLLSIEPGQEPVIFTHVVLMLHDPADIATVARQIFQTTTYPTTSLLIITDFAQRKEIEEQSGGLNYREFIETGQLRWVSKPLKPVKFAVIFDPNKLRELSTDRTQDTAQAVVLNQKQIFEEMKKRLGNQGKRVLLVEDNKTNQMVLQKFLKKVEIDVETVLDGVECTDAVFAHPHDYYSIILCDLHMPNKDGYQTCREIRNWERVHKTKYLPIIALSANVLGDVYAKCANAGFNSYVTKPVDFKELSLAILKYLDPEDPRRPIEFMKRSHTSKK